MRDLLTSWQDLPGLRLSDFGEFSEFYYLLLILIFLFGACFGSFANAASMRIVRDEDPALQPSRCRHCDTSLKWHHNMPLFGWLMLRGRSACCDTSISPRYILVEAGFGLIMVWLFATLPLAHAGLLSAASLIMMIALLTDSEAMVLHPPSLLAGMILGWAAPLLIDGWMIGFRDAMLGSLICAGLIYSINKGYYILRGHNGFGTGDVWLMGMIGAIYGSIIGIILFFLATFLGALIGIALIFAKKAEISSKLPFGLFLSVVFLLYPALNMLLN